MTAHVQEKFFIRVEKIISKEEVYEVKRDEGWYSEAEMENELSWSKHCPEIPMHADITPCTGLRVHGHCM
jgi:hypothetical protein